MEADGPDMAAVRELLSRTTVDFYYTMAGFHCPTNVTWSGEKRRALLELAREYGFTVIEDDCLGELYFDGVQEFRFGRRTDTAVCCISIPFPSAWCRGCALGICWCPGAMKSG